jgi:hypothetical protein
MLDKNEDIAYKLGKLFAICERIEVKAKGENGININKLLKSFIAKPKFTLGILLDKTNVNIQKIKKTSIGNYVFFNKLLNENLSSLDEIPDVMKLNQQGMFFIGRATQEQDFFKKNDEPLSEDDFSNNKTNLKGEIL